ERLPHVLGLRVVQLDPRLLPPEEIGNEADESGLRELRGMAPHRLVHAPDLHDGDDRPGRGAIGISDVRAHDAVAQGHLDVLRAHSVSSVRLRWAAGWPAGGDVRATKLRASRPPP